LLKVIASVLSVIGSGLLAWRVTGLLKSLTLAIKIHETTIQSLADNGQSTAGNVVVFTGAPAHVERAERRGLLVTGFVFVTASACIQLFLLL